MSAPPPATADVYLDVQRRGNDKVRGEVTAEGHDGDIGLQGWRWGALSGGAVGAHAHTARRQYRALEVTKAIDAASLPLLRALGQNEELASVTLVMCKSGGSPLPFFRLRLDGARVASVDIEVDAQGRPVEVVGFAFTGFEAEYKAQDDRGAGVGAIVWGDQVLPT